MHKRKVKRISLCGASVRAVFQFQNIIRKIIAYCLTVDCRLACYTGVKALLKSHDYTMSEKMSGFLEKSNTNMLLIPPLYSNV